MMLSETRIGELLDYASSYGMFDENTPNGTPCSHGGTPMSDLRRAAIIAYKKVLGELASDYSFPTAPQPFTIELHRSEHDEHNDGRWRWRTRCPENGNVLARSSEGYHNRGDCVAMIHRHFGLDAEIVEVGA